MTGVNCRMRNYSSSSPITIANDKAEVKFVNAVDKNSEVFDYWYKNGKTVTDFGNN